MAILIAGFAAHGGEIVDSASSDFLQSMAPRPVFIPGKREVTYDDCFPPHDNARQGDVVVSQLEIYDSRHARIVPYRTTSTVTDVSPFALGERFGIRTTSEVRAEVGYVHVASSSSEDARLRGTWILLTTMHLPGGTSTSARTRYLPVHVGNLSTGHETTIYKPGQCIRNIYRVRHEVHNAASTKEDMLTETITFLGVEERSKVAGREFPYACVFRQELHMNGSRSGVYDLYFHKYGALKTVEYDPAAPRPLVHELLQDTAADRGPDLR
ncbi:MAG TPA: hypothetical protein VIM12_01925 [Noviherbaspirillum sp.]|jgi:hypothetical protein|uniref:hypothetical protein n=1 Tax=Noviherbaspirillum sp. TaxID=1926288 RepID=UPI002F92F861